MNLTSFSVLQRDGDVVSPIEFTAKYKIHVDKNDCVSTPCAILDKYDSSVIDTHRVSSHLFMCFFLQECIFDNMALYFECRIKKNASLQTIFLAILPTG